MLKQKKEAKCDFHVRCVSALIHSQRASVIAVQRNIVYYIAALMMSTQFHIIGKTLMRYREA